MKRLLFALIFASQVFAPVFSIAQECPGLTSPLTPRAAYQKLTVSGTAVGLTVPTNAPIRMALIVVETNPIRWRDDGTNPTASVGMPADPKVVLIVCQNSLTTFKAIRQSGDAALSISYYSN